MSQGGRSGLSPGRLSPVWASWDGAGFLSWARSGFCSKGRFYQPALKKKNWKNMPESTRANMYEYE